MIEITETKIMIGLAVILFISLMMGSCALNGAVEKCAAIHGRETCIASLNP